MDEAVYNLARILRQQALIARAEMANAPDDGRASWASITPETATPVETALRAVPAIAALEGKWYHLPTEGGLISFNAVAIYLLDRAQTIAADAIVADLNRLARERTVSLIEVRLVVGIRPTRVIDMGNGFSIAPPESAPITDYSPILFSESNRPSHGWGAPPTAALVRRSTITLSFEPPPASNSVPMVEPVTSENDWHAALSACALASDAAPQFRQLYSVIDDVGWLGMRSNGLRDRQSFPIPETQATFFHEEKAASLFQKLRSAEKTIDLAIGRLISSRRRLSHEERALDLGTCVEILLMSGSKDNSEISYKIATRAAWLAGKTPEDRLRCFKAARDLYADRSLAAHTGSLKAARTMEEMTATIERLRRSDNLCVDVITELLDRGGLKADQWVSIVLDLPE